MAKLDEADLFQIAFFSLAVGAAWVTTNSVANAKNKISHDEYKQRYEKCNVISACDGEVVIERNQDTNKEYKTLSYKVAQQDDYELVIYVYSPNLAERDLYTSYIESKIYVTEDGRVLFNEGDISEYDYNEYVTTLVEDQSSNGQRVRVNTGKEN